MKAGGGDDGRGRRRSRCWPFPLRLGQSMEADVQADTGIASQGRGSWFRWFLVFPLDRLQRDDPPRHVASEFEEGNIEDAQVFDPCFIRSAGGEGG